MDPDASTTGSRASRRPPIIVRQISAHQTYALRHDVLWPDKPTAYVQLPDDEAGQHFGAFISGCDCGCESACNHTGDHNHNTCCDGNDNTAVPAQDNASSAKDNGSHSGRAADEPISVISLFLNTDTNPNPATAETAQTPEPGKIARFRKFATARVWQSRGVGSLLLAHAIEVAAARGATRIWCDARASALPFYRRFGMRGEGDVFWKGEVAYLRMGRELV
ncbi:GCN5-like N-acetyltransferase [Annulohypoxylon maeteangense]|uniref:GCN5-like N-acetyltransferase n=1 Tax=Annulohypoxylon maeteangense TaxID=1927788 RepID=UPI0020080BA7|nr:GCN5-like N-acetyltransferase [Annulohypoxylon maeteangense]KAI0888365.1 GCN5-like N-acetyltransferase [Annulohypoxylon maeteangense]